MRAMLAALLAGVLLAQVPQKKEPAKKPPPESFVQWLARVTGISATSSGLRGDVTRLSGDIWIAHIDRAGGQRLTFDGSYSWPVFSKDDQAIIAIREDELWSVPVNGAEPARLARSPKGVSELVAAGADGMVLFAGSEIGVFHPDSGEFSPFDARTEEDRVAIARMRWPIRSYGNVTVSEEEDGVAIENGGERHQIVANGGELGEPSVSHDLKLVVYVRSKR